jgi:hypothetical protein
MDIFRLTSLVNSEVLNVKSDDDFSDRLNYRYTVAILIFFSLILTTRQSLGSEVNFLFEFINSRYIPYITIIYNL